MTHAPPSLVLMGLRGSGKSTLGAMVAGRVGRPFVDLDDVTAAGLGGGDIAELWRRFGEARFREVEASALAETLGGAGEPMVLALGGGTPTAPGCAALLRAGVASGAVALVYLRGQPGTLRGRLTAQGVAGRPSLTGAGTLEEIESVFRARDPLYRELAGLIIEIEGREVGTLAQDLSILISADPPRGPRGRTP